MGVRPRETAPNVSGGSTARAGAQQPNDDLSDLASGWLLSLAGVVASATFGFVFVIVITRGLGASEAGVFFATSALFIIIMNATQFGAPSGVVRTLARLRALDRVSDIRTTLGVALSPAVLCSVLLAILIYVYAPELSRALLAGPDEEAGVPYLRALAPFLPMMAAYEVVVSATRGLGSMLPYVAISNLGIAPARPLLALAVIASGLGATAVAIAWALPQAIGLLVAIWALAALVRKAERDEPSQDTNGRKPSALASEFWRFTGPLGVAVVLQVVLLSLDTILLAALASPAEAAIYKTAASVILQGTFAQTAIVLVIGPLLSGLLAQDERQRAQSIYQTATWWIAALAWPIYLSLAIFAPLVMSLFGPEFVAGEDALRILALTMLVAMAAGPATAALVMSGRSSWNLTNVGVALSLNVILNLLLIPRLGMTGAAIAWSVSIIVSNVAPGVQLWHFIGLYALGRGFWVVAVAAVGCYGGLGLLFERAFGENAPTFVIFALLASLAYAAILWRFRVLLRLSFLRQSLPIRRLRSGGARA